MEVGCSLGHPQCDKSQVTEAPACRFDIIRENHKAAETTVRAALARPVDLTCSFRGGMNADVWIA